MDKITKKKINKFKDLKRLKQKIVRLKNMNEKDVFFNVYNGRAHVIYHTIETEKLNGYDMYNVMKALQHQLELQYNHLTDTAKAEKNFEERGGIKEYISLKNYLTDIGVDVNEIS